MIKVRLHSGVLTNTLLGAYDYEGGDLIYTVKQGDRSLREPEYDSAAVSVQTDNDQLEKAADNTWLYVGVGAIALALMAVIVGLLTKKKKPVDAEQK